MNISTHIDMTLTVLQAIGWEGDVKLAAKNAGYPDEVRSIEVEGLGAHVVGRNLASLAHFIVPYGEEKFGGYCWKTDRSVPHLDLSKRRVVPKPEAWGFPVIPSFLANEPLMELVHDLTLPGHQGSIEADQITYPAASIMADWVFRLFDLWAHDGQTDKRQEALDTLCGWMMHLGVQDPSVPHHALGVLLDGHSAFESDVDECWNRMKASGETSELLKTLVASDNCPRTLTARGLAEDLASSIKVSARRIGWYRWFWRPGWNKQVRACVLRGLLGSVKMGKLLQREAAR